MKKKMKKTALFLGQPTTNRNGWVLLNPTHRALFVATRISKIAGEGSGCRLQKCSKSNCLCKYCAHNYLKYYDPTPTYASDFVRYFSIFNF